MRIDIKTWRFDSEGLLISIKLAINEDYERSLKSGVVNVLNLSYVCGNLIREIKERPEFESKTFDAFFHYERALIEPEVRIVSKEVTDSPETRQALYALNIPSSEAYIRSLYPEQT